jgi:hypothetical protein
VGDQVKQVFDVMVGFSNIFPCYSEVLSCRRRCHEAIEVAFDSCFSPKLDELHRKQKGYSSFAAKR